MADPSVSSRSGLLPPGLAGTGPSGSFFETPGWVDQSKAPGHSSQAGVVGAPGWWKPLVTGRFLLFSPNLIYLSITLLTHWLAPYDIQAARSLSHLDWVLYRLELHIHI